MIASSALPELDDAIRRWSELAEQAPPRLTLPAERPGPLAADVSAQPLERCVSAAETGDAVRACAEREGLRDADVWLAGYVALLHRYAGETRLAIAVHETSPEAPSLALVSVDVAPGMSFRDLLRNVARDGDVARAERCCPFAALPKLRAALGQERPRIAHAAFGWRPAFRTPGPSEDAGLELGLFVDGSGTAARVRVRYLPAAFESVTVERLIGHLQTLLAAAAARPELGVLALPMLTPGERDTFATWNATARPLRSQANLVDLLRERAARSPDAIAVEYEGCVLSYAALDERAERLATYLAGCGVGAGTLVALLVERSLDMVVAVLGVQRAGGAYVPIDADYPRDRIDFMLADSGAALVIVHESLRAKLPANVPRVVSLDADRPAIDGVSSAASHAVPRADDLAYVIYTSGSTGRPKGVAIEHRQVVNFLAGMEAAVQLRPGHTLVAVASLAFDISGLDMYLPLTTGARVVLAPRDVAVDPKALRALLERSGVTHMHATPSTWRMLVDAGWRGQRDLVILCGGEALSQQLAGQLRERAAEVWNLYGPTEATIWATLQRVTAGEAITIGRPMANVTAYVLDAALQPVPVGVAGDLFLGGAGIARGYLNRPELTEQRFVADPFSSGGGARMYRTGDVARFCGDGRLDYSGRADFQIKLRGYRIELGEIEAALAAQNDVRAALALVREDTPGEQRLVAYVVVAPGARLGAASLRRALVEKLPAYMVPEAIVVLDELPLNTNGKVDRGRLPAPERGRSGERDDSDGYVAARSGLERRLVAIWEDVLDMRPVGVTDDFFDLGASSIAAARVFDRIERELGATLPLSPLFAAPTIEKLAAQIERGRSDGRYTSLVPIQPKGERTPIFWVHGGAGTILHFQPLARALGAEQPFYGFQMQGLYGDAPPHVSVETMAAHYVCELRSVQPHGPYALAGYCFGAIVAVEMAHQLERAGERVALLAAVNGPSPRYIRAHRIWRGKRWALRAGWYVLRARLSAVLRRPLADRWRQETIFLIAYDAETRYRPRVYSGKLLLFKAAGLYDEETLGWRDLFARGVEVVEIPGEQKNGRSTMQEPHVRHIGSRLTEELRCAMRSGEHLE
ncbi:MAG: amino acid adenylation domain-containing protein [Vulcanimicrobiaceae bacterium]